MDVIRMDEGWQMDAGLAMDQAMIVPPPAPPGHKRKGKVMDYIPYKRDGRYLWYKNLSANVVAEAVKFGGVAADATAIKALADGIIAKYDATNAAQLALDAARVMEHNAEPAALAQIRAKVRNWKTLANYPSSGSEGVLQLHGTDSPFDPTTYKAEFTATPASGGVRLDFTKKGADRVAFYSRLRGTVPWHSLGTHTDSPHLDVTPLAQAGVPEAREYMARGMVHDAEIGQDSDVANVTFAG